MKKAVFSSVLCTFLLFSGMALAAQPFFPGGSRGDAGLLRHLRAEGEKCDLFQPGAQLDRTAEILGLTAEQKQQVVGIAEEEQKAVQALRAKMEAVRGQMDEEFSKETLDEAALRKLGAEQGQAGVEIRLLRRQTKAKIGQVLTPEQAKVVKLAMEMRGPRSHGPRAIRPHKGPGPKGK